MFKPFQLKFSKIDSFEIAQYFEVTYYHTFSHEHEFLKKEKSLETQVLLDLDPDRASIPWDASPIIVPSLGYIESIESDGWLQGGLHRDSLRVCCT